MTFSKAIRSLPAILAFSGFMFVSSAAKAEGIKWPGADESVSEPKTFKFIGEARTLDGKVFFTEEHRVTVVKGRVLDVTTNYTEGEGTTGKKLAEFKSDFRKNPYLPDYTFEDVRHGYENGLLLDQEQKKVMLTRRRSEEKEPKKDTMKFSEDMVAGQGIFFVVMAESAKLEDGSVKKVDFVVPIKLDDYGFRIYKVKEQSNSDSLVLRVDIDNWLLRMFAPKIETVIDKKTRRVTEYRGASVVADEKMKFPEIVIRYKYLD